MSEKHALANGKNRTCFCGCPGEVGRGSFYLPGHDLLDGNPEDICGKRGNHHPKDHPWSLTATCTRKPGHGEGDDATICKGHVAGHWILWWGYA